MGDIEATPITDPGPVPTEEDNPYAQDNAQRVLREAAVQKLMDDFGFTEEVARAVVGI